MTQNLLYKILCFFSAALLVQFTEQTLTASDIPQEGLVLHLDAGSLVGLADGAALSGGWQDLSDATISAMSEAPPTFLTDAGSGYPAVRFNGVDQYLDVGVTTGEAVSIFIVFAHQRPSLPLLRTVSFLQCPSWI